MSNSYKIKKNDNFGLRLELFIKINFESAAEFARLIDVDRSRVTSYVKGRSAPNVKILIRIYDIGANIIWLLTGKGAMYSMNDAGRSLYSKNKDKYHCVQHESDEDIERYLQDTSLIYEPDKKSDDTADIENDDDNDDNYDDVIANAEEYFHNLAEQIKMMPDIIKSLTNK